MVMPFLLCSYPSLWALVGVVILPTRLATKPIGGPTNRYLCRVLASLAFALRPWKSSSLYYRLPSWLYYFSALVTAPRQGLPLGPGKNLATTFLTLHHALLSGRLSIRSMGYWYQHSGQSMGYSIQHLLHRSYLPTHSRQNPLCSPFPSAP